MTFIKAPVMSSALGMLVQTRSSYPHSLHGAYILGIEKHSQEKRFWAEGSASAKVWQSQKLEGDQCDWNPLGKGGEEVRVGGGRAKGRRPLRVSTKGKKHSTKITRFTWMPTCCNRFHVSKVLYCLTIRSGWASWANSSIKFEFFVVTLPPSDMFGPFSWAGVLNLSVLGWQKHLGRRCRRSSLRSRG